MAAASSSSSARTPASAPASASASSSELDRAKFLISEAIAIGAPAYNAGDIAGCARVYRSTARDVLALVPAGSLREGLADKLERLPVADDASAWAFRNSFDEILGYRVPYTPAALAGRATKAFGDAIDLPAPVPVLDNVMGGRSQGQWNARASTFFGRTSLANNGGFASLRWRFPGPRNWADAKGVYLKIAHSDPSRHTFALTVKDSTCERVRLSNYKAVFANPGSADADDDRAVLVPFSAFDTMEQIGRPVNGAPTMNPSSVTELGIMAIKPTVVGDFELAIREWGLYY